MTRIGLNFTPIMMMAAARGLDLVMLAELLPLIEPSVINPVDERELEGDDDGDQERRLPAEDGG